ncbi:PREDICTED: peptidoglycan recognition protein 1-like [Elephantulus edwardii]|uniref:peptidoglycan recognition protein 1-like n=1 Tax=Elephantulus edwardii TaxID=28737 RepID=UPI0003F06709|nr:PREDICTED: peptidoglycan recognition protein 1-like [Elephantulus edwardii]
MSPRCALLTCALLAFLAPLALGEELSEELSACCSLVVPRGEWRATASSCSQKLSLPARYVIVSHTAGASCDSPASCQQQARNVQYYHVRERKWCDVAYNFLIGDDGLVYEGRGWDTKGDHTGYIWNPMSIGITFMGNYMERVPPARALRAAQNLLACGVARGALLPQYEVKGHRDVQQTQSPGDQLYAIIQNWPHYRD